MTDRLTVLFAETLNVDSATISDATSPQNTPAWDSLNNMILLAGIEETYEVELSSDEITRMKTLGDVRAILAARGVDA